MPEPDKQGLDKAAMGKREPRMAPVAPRPIK
jgi:hypothetical protein